MAKKEKFDIYQHVTNRFITSLEEGVVPWRKPWGGVGGFYKSLSSGNPYRGINQILLAVAGDDGYTSPWWGTYQEIARREGQVRKGEKSTQIVFWGKAKSKEVNPKTGNKDEYFLMRYFNVFNAEQAEGLVLPVDETEEVHHDPIETAEAIAEGYPSPPSKRVGGDRACYSPSSDTITVPDHSAFDVNEEYYSTLFHELAHSTGHETRLKREGITDFDAFGSHQYSKEELVAEIGAAFLCAHAGIEQETLDNSTSYINSWLSRLKNDKRMVVQAAQQAQKAADHILDA